MYIEVSRNFFVKERKIIRVVVNSNLDMIRHALLIRNQTGPPVVNNNYRLPNYLKYIRIILKIKHLLLNASF